MMTIDSIRARAARLQQLNLGLAEEAARWKGAESPLLDAERQAYLKCIQDGIGSFDAAWHALTAALARIDQDGPPSYLPDRLNRGGNIKVGGTADA